MPVPPAKEVPRDKRSKLAIVRASDHGSEPDQLPPGTEYPLDTSPVVFGLSATGTSKREHTLYLEGLARPHAYFELRDDGWWVCDAGSTSGTWVARKKVSAHKLANGERVALGSIGDPDADDGSGVVLEFNRWG
jgi:hypothetical protein